MCARGFTGHRMVVRDFSFATLAGDTRGRGYPLLALPRKRR